MSEVVLYHIPPSFYSQIARIVLWELEVPFQAKLVAPGPPTFDTYQPWYLKLNPMGTVPTLVHGNRAVPDSDAIMRYAAEHLSSVTLVPETQDERDVMEGWIAALRAISLRELSYGAEKTRKMGARINKIRLKVLAKRRHKNPDMAETYSNKIDDIAGFAERAVDPVVAQAHQRQVYQKLDELNGVLADHPWITGASYSLADAVWTVAVARFIMLKLDPLKGRPDLQAWYARVKARPSFRQADIWEAFRISSMLKAVGTRFRGQILVGSGILIALFWWCCRG